MVYRIEGQGLPLHDERLSRTSGDMPNPPSRTGRDSTSRWCSVRSTRCRVLCKKARTWSSIFAAQVRHTGRGRYRMRCVCLARRLHLRMWMATCVAGPSLGLCSMSVPRAVSRFWKTAECALRKVSMWEGTPMGNARSD
eukprot:5814080-Amphidinium_carterae.1